MVNTLHDDCPSQIRLSGSKEENFSQDDERPWKPNEEFSSWSSKTYSWDSDESSSKYFYIERQNMDVKTKKENETPDILLHQLK